MDYNGDGKTDICLFTPSGMRVYSFIESKFMEIASSSLINKYTIRNNFMLGDLNGDGLMDILVPPQESGYLQSFYSPCGDCDGCWNDYDPNIPVEHYCHSPYKEYNTVFPADYDVWKVFIATGIGYTTKTYKYEGNLYIKYQDGGILDLRRNFMLMDVDNDGVDDLVIKEGDKIYVMFNNNKDGVFTYRHPRSNEYTNAPIYGNLISINRNTLGSPQRKILSFDPFRSNQLHYCYFNRDKRKRQLLTSYYSSLGIKGKFSYTNVADKSMTTAGMQQFPYIREKYLNFNIVSEAKIYLGDNCIFHEDYSYIDPTINRQGLGFKGFGQVKTVDYINGGHNIKYYDHMRFGVLTEISSYAKSQFYASWQKYKYDIRISSIKNATIHLIEKNTYDYLKDQTVITTYTYDDYSNPLTETVDYGSGTKKTATNSYNYLTFTYPYYSNQYKVNELKEQAIKDERGGSSSTVKTEYLYNEKHLLTDKISYYGTNKVQEEKFTYSAQNLIAEHHQRSYESTNWLITKYKHNIWKLLTEKVTPDGTKVVNGYDEFLRLASVTNYNSSEANTKMTKIAYEYGAWSRLAKTTFPDGTIETATCQWDPSSPAALGGYFVRTVATGQPTKEVYYDALKREVGTGTTLFDGKKLKTQKQYNNQGLLVKEILPYSSASPTLWTEYVYDDYNRPTSVKKMNTSNQTLNTRAFSYDKNTVTTVSDGVSQTKTYDASGALTKVTDIAGSIEYYYKPDGQTSKIVAPGSVETSFTYDKYGRKTSIVDPSAGTKQFGYDAVGNVSKETNADNKVVSTVYDQYNRVTSTTADGATTTFTYADNLLTKVASANSTQTMEYDNYNRVSKERETVIDGKWLEKTDSYADGNIASITYTANTGAIGTEYMAYKNGHHYQTKFGSTVVWELKAENSMGQPTQALTGVLTRAYDYDTNGLPVSRSARVTSSGSIIQNFTYSFNPATGNLNWRKDNSNNRNIQENFTYDNLNRLTGFAGKTMSYDIKGNITNIPDVGSFEYNTLNKPYAVSTITPYGNAIPQREQTITYNTLMRPASITENGYNATFTYDSDGNRVKMFLKKNNATELTRYYIGGQYEQDSGIAGAKERLYLGGDAYSAAAVYVKQNGSWQMQYILRDYLGSITHVTNDQGIVLQELSYDPWGRLRNPVNQVLYAVDLEPVLLLDRGYTGHEHLTMFGLINMNARLYDPVVGRFLSPDPYVQVPDFSQNFNRYSYCLNNPLRYTDPNGEFFFSALIPGLGTVIDAMCWGALIGAGTSAVANVVTGNWSWSSIAMGAVGGAIGGGFSSIGGSFANTLGYNILSQTTSTVVTDMIFGNEFSWKAIPGIAAGGLVSSFLPRYNAVKGGGFRNFATELGINTARGTISGSVSGATKSLFTKDANDIWRGALGGAIGSASSTIATNMLFGHGEISTQNYIDNGKDMPVNRSGGIAYLFTPGISWGRTAWSEDYFNNDIKVEENYHYYQQKQMGFARFYGRTIKEYGKGFFQGDWQKAYSTEGTLEYDAARVVKYYKNYKSSKK